jgi:quercetin dioxygenase-like cupin family protein
VLRQIADGTSYTAVDVFGPTVEFVSGPDDPGADFWVMRGVVPPGVTVPLHSHDDAEDFFILSGTQQVLSESESGLQWCDVNAGDYVHIPAGIPHAHRNVSDEPAVELVITAARLGRFFQEIARPGATQPPLYPRHARTKRRCRHRPELLISARKVVRRRPCGAMRTSTGDRS